MASEPDRILATQHERIQAEIAELKAYDQAVRSTREEIRRLEAKQNDLSVKGKRYSQEYKDVGQQLTEQKQHLDQQWHEVQSNYPDIAIGKTGEERFVSQGGYNVLMTDLHGDYHDLDMQRGKVTLEQAIPLREEHLKILASQQTLTTLKDTIDPVKGRQASPPAPAQTLTQAEIAAHFRAQETMTPAEQIFQLQERAALSDKGVTPLKETLDAIDPDRTSSGSGTGSPPPPAGWWQSFVDSVKNWFPSPLQVPEAPSRPFEQQLEQRPGGRQTVEEYEKPFQAQREQEFHRHMDQYYEQQPPGTPTPAPHQPGHLKDLTPTPSSEQPGPPPPTPPKPTSQQQQVQPGHFKELFTVKDQLQDIERGLDQIQSDIAREQGQQVQWKTPFRQMFDQPPPKPGDQAPPDQQHPQEPEQQSHSL